MSKKEDKDRILVRPEDEAPVHRKRSKSSAKSNIEKRSDHKHDYEKVIIESGLSGEHEYFWAKRCRICGRVDDSGMFKPGSSDDFIKRRAVIRLKSGETCNIPVFYSLYEIRNNYPGIDVLRYNPYNRGYEEVKT